MSRNEGKIGAGDGTPIDAAEILAEIAGGQRQRVRRQDAVACYLSGSDGWKEALAALGGAFASPARQQDEG